MRLRRTVPLVAVLTLAACASPVPVPSLGVHAAGVGVATHAVTITGVVKAPAGLLSQDSASLINSDGASLINSDGASALTGPVKARRLLALNEVPLAGTSVYLADGAGNRRADAGTGKTDAHGAFTLRAPSGGTYQVIALAKAAHGQVHLSTLARAGDAATTKADVTVASTLVASVLQEARTPLEAVDTLAFGTAVDATGAQLSADGVPDLTDHAAVHGYMQDLASKNPAVGRVLERLAIPATPQPSAVTTSSSPAAVPAPGFDALAVTGGPPGQLGPTRSLVVANGVAWVDTDHGFAKLGANPPGSSMAYATPKFAPTAVAADAAGNLWAPDDVSYGLVRITPEGAMCLSQWRAANAPRGIAVTDDDAKWLCGQAMVARFGTGQLKPDVFKLDRIALAIAPAGNGVWLALPDRVLLVQTGFSTAATVKVADVDMLSADGQGGAWFHNHDGIGKLSSNGDVTLVPGSANMTYPTALDATRCCAVDIVNNVLYQLAATGATHSDKLGTTFQGIAKAGPGKVLVLVDNQLKSFP